MTHRCWSNWRYWCCWCCGASKTSPRHPCGQRSPRSSRFRARAAAAARFSWKCACPPGGSILGTSEGTETNWSTHGRSFRKQMCSGKKRKQNTNGPFHSCAFSPDLGADARLELSFKVWSEPSLFQMSNISLTSLQSPSVKRWPKPTSFPGSSPGLARQMTLEQTELSRAVIGTICSVKHCLWLVCSVVLLPRHVEKSNLHRSEMVVTSAYAYYAYFAAVVLVCTFCQLRGWVNIWVLALLVLQSLCIRVLCL